MRPIRGIPQIALPRIQHIVWPFPIRRGRVGSPRQQIPVGGRKVIGCHAACHRGDGYVHIAVQTIVIQAEAACRIERHFLAFDHIGGASRGGPRPAVVADFRTGHHVVEGDEGFRQIVLIGRDRLAKLGQSWVAIADFQVAQDLVVAPVLLDDEDHMLDALMHGRHDCGIAVALGGGEVAVDRHPRGQRG